MNIFLVFCELILILINAGTKDRFYLIKIKDNHVGNDSTTGKSKQVGLLLCHSQD